MKIMFTLSTQLQAYQLAYTIAGRLIYFVYTIADRLIDQLPRNIADRLLHFDYSTFLQLLDILSASKKYFSK